MHNTEADALVLRLAQTQHGVVARWQLIGARIPATLINGRIARRRLEPVAPRVYRVPGIDGPRRDRRRAA